MYGMQEGYMNVIRESHTVTVRKRRLRQEHKKILDMELDPNDRKRWNYVKNYIESRRSERLSRASES